MPRTSSLTGMKFGRLTTLELAPHVYSGNRYRVAWKCACSCGGEIIATADCLREGNVRSCGCLYADTRNTTHGASRTPEYVTWHQMIQRCCNPKDRRFKHYGGRGISVCDRWRFGENGKGPFECFIADIGHRPTSPADAKRSQFSIDRIDNNDSYRPGNVRWATNMEQAHNKRTYRRSSVAVENAPCL
jgi:hypothetical protein